jgi:uncharacterized membrane protein YdjX (TVP38/TMEM64 family)
MESSPPAPLPSTAPSLRDLGRAGALGLVWAVLPGILGVTLLASIGTVSDWLVARGPWGLPIYSLAFAASAGLGLLPTYAQAILGGWVFGLALGFPAALLGFTLAALVGYLLARWVAGDSLERLLARDRRLLVVRDALVRERHGRTLLVTALLRIPPTSPFSLMNLAFASARVAVGPFLLGTTFGLAPRTLVYVWMGAAGAKTGAHGLGELAKNSKGLWQLALGIGLTLLVLTLLQRMAQKALERTLGSSPTQPDPKP